jgi:hypothetical protein
MNRTTIIYLTNNILNPIIFKKAQEFLLKAASDIPIISVSQKPVNLGTNICVGEIGSSWLNIYKQQLIGLKACNTKYAAIAEHDVFYIPEHFKFTPPRDDTFYYNENRWFVQYEGNHPQYNNMYSKMSHLKALSQLICSRKLLIESIEERLYLIDSGIKQMRRLGEPGAFVSDIVKGAMIATSGSKEYLRPFLDKHLKKFKSEFFKTKNPNIDIRHFNNFTGPRRGKSRCYSIPYWGKFEGILKNDT